LVSASTQHSRESFSRFILCERWKRKCNFEKLVYIDQLCIHETRHFYEKYLGLKFLLGTIWSKNKRTPIKLFQSELWRWDDDSILTTQPLVSLIYSALECKIQCSHILQRKSGAVDLIKPGDQIMVDKGFLIDEDVITRGGVVIRPAFKNAKQQFNPQQVESSTKIASVRIYV
jgi:hypothetical protein